MTEDAWTAPAGHLEIEAWLEGIADHDDLFGLGLVQLGYGITEHLEVAAAAGIGLDARTLEVLVPNPYAYFKLRLLDPVDGGRPGLGVMAGFAPPVGRGAPRVDETAIFGLVPVTASFFEERLAVHLNLGVTAALAPEASARPFWGVGAEVAIGDSPIHAIAELTAGDPFDPLGPVLGGQVGGYWEVGEAFTVDLAVGAMVDPDHAGDLEWILRLGVAWLLDFTR